MIRIVWLTVLVLACLPLSLGARDAEDLSALFDKLDPAEGLGPEMARDRIQLIREKLKLAPDRATELRLREYECQWHVRHWRKDAQDGLRFARETSQWAAATHAEPGQLALFQLCEAAALVYVGDFNEVAMVTKKIVDNQAASTDPKALALRASALSYLATASSRTGKLSQALEAYQEAYRVFEKLGAADESRRMLRLVGDVYGDMKAFDKALEYYKRVLAEYEQAGNAEQVLITLHYIGMTYDDMGRYEDALACFMRELKEARAARNAAREASALVRLGGTFTSLNRPQEALVYIEQSAKYMNATGQPGRIAQVHMFRGLAYGELGRIEDGLREIDLAYPVFKQQNNLPGLRSVHKARAPLYARLGEWERAYREDAALREVNDQIAARDREVLDGRLRVEFDTARKEKENELLQREKALLAQSDAAKASELRQAAQVQRWRTLALVFGAVLLAALALLFLRLRKQAARIRVQKLQVEGALADLKRAQEQMVLQEKMASIGTLTAGVAHEINNPANFAHVGAQTLDGDLQRFRVFLMKLAGDTDHEVTEALNLRLDELTNQVATIAEGTTRIRDLVKDLRSFSRLDEADRKVVPVTDSLMSTLNLVRPQFSDTVRIDCTLDHNPLLECWPAQLNQVFMNVLINACQAVQARQRSAGGAAAGVVTLRNRIVDDWLEIDFEDDGCGMSAQVLARIFEPFYTTKDVGEGTGLGLSISFGIVRRHDGEIKVRSTEGVGTCVTVRLPLQGAAVLAEAA